MTDPGPQLTQKWTLLNQAQNSTTEKSTDAQDSPVNAQREVTDLEPEPDVSGGMRCQDNLKQMGIG